MARKRIIDTEQAKAAMKGNVVKKQYGYWKELPENVILHKVNNGVKEKAYITEKYDIVNNEANVAFTKLYVHKDIGDTKEKKICPRTFGKKCPLCERGYDLRGGRTNDSIPAAELKTIQALKAQERLVYLIYDVNNNIKVLDVSRYFFQEALENGKAKADDPSVETYSQDNGGKTLFMDYKLEDFGKHNFYKEVIVSEFKDRPDVPEEVLEKAFDPLDYLVETTADELRAIVGMETADVEDFSEEVIESAQGPFDPQQDIPSKKDEIDDEIPWD